MMSKGNILNVVFKVSKIVFTGVLIAFFISFLWILFTDITREKIIFVQESCPESLNYGELIK